MTRYIYSDTMSFGTDGTSEFAEYDVTASFTVDWGDHYPDSQVEDIRIEFIDGKPATSPELVKRCIAELEDIHWFEMLDEAYEARAELDAERQDRRDEDAHERAWSE